LGLPPILGEDAYTFLPITPKQAVLIQPLPKEFGENGNFFGKFRELLVRQDILVINSERFSLFVII
jgi:hypothetical protein